MDPRSDTKYWVALARIPRLGARRFQALEAFFPTMEEAWRASRADLRRAGLEERLCSAILAARPAIDPDAEMERLERHGVHVLTWRDPDYPKRLGEIDDRPPVLFVRGQLRPEDEWAVAVVGTRRATPYGRQVAEVMTGELAASGVTVVSGLARGIDAVAHRAALAAGGRTIAVMACGLDIIYPAEHTRLAQEIIEHGALVSEQPLGAPPRADYFPRRNRIMSGLSLGVLVVEGDAKSGALITARQALDQNRDVFAVPGSIFAPSSRGTNKLIREGEARLVLSATDILEELNLTVVAHQPPLAAALPADDAEALLLQHLGLEPAHIDEVGRAVGLPIATVSSALAMLELKGLVRQVGSMNYVRARLAESPARRA